MVLIPTKRVDGTLVFKTCVYGPSESGRKTVIEWLASGKLNETKDEKGSMLFFDHISESISNIIFQVYTLDVSDESNTRTVLKDADAVIFTWDSLIDQWSENIWSLKELLRFYGDKLIPPEAFAPPEGPPLYLLTKGT